jgi:hypothetical protein
MRAFYPALVEYFIRAYTFIMKKSLFENSMLETSTFDIIVNKCITDLNSACGVLDVYFFYDRFIESEKYELNRLKNLIPAFKRIIRAIQGDIALLEKYQFRGQLPPVEKQMNKLIDLLEDLFILRRKFYSHAIEPKNEAKELRLIMQELLKKLKEKITLYNKRVRKLNYKILSRDDANDKEYHRFVGLKISLSFLTKYEI